MQNSVAPVEVIFSDFMLTNIQETKDKNTRQQKHIKTEKVKSGKVIIHVRTKGDVDI